MGIPVLISLHNELGKVGNAAISLPSTLIRHENEGFRKRTFNQRSTFYLMWTKNMETTELFDVARIMT